LTTLQALDLANGQILNETLTRGAANLVKAHKKASADELIDAIFLQALCRPPTAKEQAIARQIVGSPMTADNLTDLLWAVVMLPEFQLIR
jgi:hypothetical protein